MNEARALLTNTAALGVSKVIERACTVLLTIVVARKFGAAALGVYAAAMVVLNLVALTAEMGSNAYLVREIARDKSQTSRYLAHITVIVATLSLLVTIVAFGIVDHLGYSLELTRAIYMVLFAAFPAAMRVVLEAVFVAYQRVTFIAYCSAIGGATLIAVSVVLMALGYGVITLIAAVGVEQIVITVASFLFIRGFLCPIHWEFQITTAIRILREIKAFTGFSLLTGLLSRPEILILSAVRSVSEVGYYAAALRFVDLWQLVPQTYMVNLYPLLSRFQGHTKFDLIRDKSIQYLVAFSLPVAAATVVLARPIIQFLYGTTFSPSIPLMRLLAINIPLVSLWTALWRILAAHDAAGTVLQSQVLAMIVRLLAGTALIIIWGSMGAAVIVPIAQFLVDGLLLAAAHRRGADIRIVRLSWRFALATGLMSLSMIPLVPHFRLWLLIPLSGIVYIVATIAVGAFSTEDLELVRRMSRKESLLESSSA